ncbi:MAG: alpha/beta hydrolase [Sedimentisphaerales bacterium]|nr:alpha/beta hydrolase [Sedimentisphaerales bacterium]
MLISIAVVLFVAYSGLGLVLYFMQPVFLYSPVQEVPYTPEELGLDFEKVTFKSSDGLKLSGWYIPAANSELTVLFCHGNGGNMMHCLDTINILYNMGLNCFIFDYRGYGNSKGKPSEEGTYLDARAAYKWLTEEKKVSPENIIVFGRSLGGSIAAHLASKVRVGALIIESAFTSYVDIGRKFYPYMPVRWFARFSYRTIDYIKKVHRPVMIIHSRTDETIPFEFGLELYEAANEPKEFVEIFGSHNDGFLVSSETYKSAWTKWLKSLKKHKGQVSRTHAS